MSIDVELGEGLRLRRPIQRGFWGYFEDNRFKIRDASRVRETLPESQGRILAAILRMKAATPLQLSREVGMSSPAIAYSLARLQELGVVSRVEVPGGGAFYVPNWEVKTRLSPSLKQSCAH